MKAFLAVALLTTSVFPAVARSPLLLPETIPTEIAHGGGCRKDSPPGQCCHAGSKPLHCH